MSISNDIARMLLAMLDETGRAEIQRNELAEQLGCVPSQINYVISSRFTPENGYTVESRRGGGGYIKITRINYSAKEQMLMHIINCITNYGNGIYNCRNSYSNTRNFQCIKTNFFSLSLITFVFNCFLKTYDKFRHFRDSLCNTFRFFTFFL